MICCLSFAFYLFTFALISGALDQQRESHAAAHAERCKPAPSILFLHLVKQRCSDANARAAYRMAERDCSAVRVQTFCIEFQFTVTCYDLSGERFVQFYEINVI